MSTDNMQPPDTEEIKKTVTQTVSDLTFEVTYERRYQCGKDHIIVQIQDTMLAFRWRMRVNGGEMSQSYSLYRGMLEHDGYRVGTAYWGATFPEFIPFRIVLAEEVK